MENRTSAKESAGFLPISRQAWRAAYDTNDAVIYLLDKDRRIIRCNPAWDQFALTNHGEAAVSSKVIGNSIMDAVPDVLREFYLIAYDNVERHRKDWWHIFECSSPTSSRLFQMRILPCEEGALLTINTLIGETTLEAAEPKPVEDYAGSDGIAVMCSHCRRVRRVDQPAIWDWVPELLMSGQVLATFDLCDFCTAYHYHVR